MTTKEIIEKYHDLSHAWNRTFNVKMYNDKYKYYYSDSLDEIKRQRCEIISKTGDEKLKQIHDEFENFMATEWEKKE